jgi:hypothetical protein
MKAQRTRFRTSVSLTQRLARRVRQIARVNHTSANKVLLDLIQDGMRAREGEKRRFVEITQRLVDTKSTSERQALKKELARMTFRH